MRNQLTYEEEEQENKEEKKITYEAKTKMNGENVNFSMCISANKDDVSKEDPKLIAERKEKIKNIKDVLEGFMASKFMKSMANATPVRSPIRKTNVILKEQNFIKALALWEFLEKYQNSFSITILTAFLLADAKPIVECLSYRLPYLLSVRYFSTGLIKLSVIFGEGVPAFIVDIVFSKFL